MRLDLMEKFLHHNQTNFSSYRIQLDMSSQSYKISIPTNQTSPKVPTHVVDLVKLPSRINSKSTLFFGDGGHVL